LPKEKLAQAKTTIENWLNDAPGYLLENGLCNVLEYIQQPFDKDLSGALAEVTKLDQRRGTDHIKIFPELYYDC
jgi:hypothetical protein